MRARSPNAALFCGIHPTPEPGPREAQGVSKAVSEITEFTTDR